eukprot:TRINITY_DN3079_c0_g1_i2.p1 TRINITY_DN3079_c0_g1~~TRINITY_DN3079_c0_g1_i2.p1  ORF type:complete len:1844 (-),score=154.28 TRINITY_DN3079_c0_g1_i2:13547-19078(-)
MFLGNFWYVFYHYIQQVLVDGKITFMKIKYPIHVSLIKLCENFSGSLSSVLLYDCPLSPAQITAIYKNFPNGLSDYSALKGVSSLPSEGLILAFSPFFAHEKTVFNLANTSGAARIYGTLKGNAAIVNLSFQDKYLFPASGVLPVLFYLFSAKGTKASELLEDTLKTLKILVDNLHSQMKGSVRMAKECKEISSALFYCIGGISPCVITEKCVQIIESLIPLIPEIVSGLLTTRKVWAKTIKKIQTEYWRVLRENSEAIIKDNCYKTIVKLVKEIDEYEESVVDFTSDLIKRMPEYDRSQTILMILSEIIVSPTKVSERLLQVLIDSIGDATAEDVGMVAAFYDKIMEKTSSEDTLKYLELINAITYPSIMKHEVKEFMWKRIIKYFNFRNEGKILVKKSIKIERAESKLQDSSMDLDELERRVGAESEGIKQSIQKIYDMKKDIERVKDSSGNEQLQAAQNEPAPPPAPRGERNRSKKFTFGLPTPTESLSKLDTPSSEPAPLEKKLFINKGKPKFLAIDTESINKEYTCGGERGYKLVDEAEEEKKFEEELLQLAERCVKSMHRLGVNQVQVVNFLIGQIAKRSNTSVLSAVGKLLPHITHSEKFLDIVDTLIAAFEQSEEWLIKASPYFMERLMKTQVKLYAESNMIYLERITTLNTMLILGKIHAIVFPFSVYKALDKSWEEPQIIQESVKGLWGNVLKTFYKDIKDTSVKFLAEFTFAILICMDKLNEAAPRPASPFKTYSNGELINMLFDILQGAQLTSDITVTVEPTCKWLVPFSHCITLLLCSALESSYASGTALTQRLIKVLEDTLDHFANCLNVQYNKQLEENTLLLIGFALKKSVDDATLPEHSAMYRIEVLKSLASEKAGSGLKSFYKQKLFIAEDLSFLAKEEIAKVEVESFIEQNIHISKELDKLTEHYYGRLAKSIKHGIHIELLRKNEEEKGQISTRLNNMEQEAMKIVTEYIKERETLLSNIQSWETIETLKKQQKWRKIQKAVTGWQGAWRSRELFDTQTLPMKISSHRFANALRCIFTLRRKPFSYYYDQSNEKLGGFSKTTFDKLNCNFYTGPISICNPYKLACTLYESMNKKTCDKLFAPLPIELFKGLYVAKGWGLLYQSKSRKPYLIFAQGKDESEDEDPRVMFKGKLGSLSKGYYKWRLSDVKKLVKKQIVESKTGLEIIFYNGRTLLLNFVSEEKRDMVASKLVRLRERWCKYLQYDGSLDSLRVFEKNRFVEKWENRQISTLDYLMAVNMHASRSYDNLSQYPVFPWMLFETEAGTLRRDLAKNIGMAGDPDRAEEFKKRFSQEDITGLGHFHFGSHFSNPGIVLQYLMRVYPFFEGYLKFFLGLDDPNRMFHSISDSSQSCIKDIADVRELVPEFYTCPEIFYNNEQHIFGKRAPNDEKVDRVILPEWATDSPYIYVSKLRETLEEDNNGIEQWIDLVFGCFQRGKNAEYAYNLFPQIAYDPHKQLSEVKTRKSLYEGYRLQAYHWGQVPKQLFLRKHRARTKLELSFWEGDVKEIVMHNKAKTEVIGLSVSDSNEFTLISLNGCIQSGSLNFAIPDPISISSTRKLNYEPQSSTLPLACLDPAISTPVFLLMNRGDLYMAQGGYWDGSIQLIPLVGPSNMVLTLAYHRSTVVCMAKDKYERVVLAGTKGGECAVYSIHENMFWRPECVLIDHEGEITDIRVSDGMQIFATAGADGSVNIYNIDYKPRLLRTIRHITPIHNIALAQNPLPCVLMFSRTNSTLSCYSINGTLLAKTTNETMALSPIILSDHNFSDHAVYASNHCLVIRKLPFLEPKEIPLELPAKVTYIAGCRKCLFICRDDDILSLLYRANAQHLS